MDAPSVGFIPLLVLMSFLSLFAVFYFCGLAVLGMRESKRQGLHWKDQEAIALDPVDHDVDLAGFTFFVMAPCLNEERVVGGTISTFLESQSVGTLLVIDDGSDDRTAEIIDEYVGSGRVVRLSRAAPNARLGKGRALNEGLSWIRKEVKRQGLKSSQVIVGVIDADGRMTPNALREVAGGFATDTSIGGVQLAVRVRNYKDSFLLTLQDHSFWAVVALNELGRNFFGSAAMGGNGQFIRLSCLNELGTEPWTDSLTEDLDLGISISVAGWRSIGVAKAYVTQQGVDSLRRLVNQWTRWAQGTMICGRRVPELVRSRYISNLALIEILGCLATPWVAMTWSVTEQWLAYMMISGQGFASLDDTPMSYKIMMILQWYVLGFMPSIFWTWVYMKRTTGVPFWKAWLVSHMLLPWSWLALVTTWRALGRIVLGRSNWVKTSREVEDPLPDGLQVVA